MEDGLHVCGACHNRGRKLITREVFLALAVMPICQLVHAPRRYAGRHKVLLLLAGLLQVARVVPQLISSGRVLRPSLGVQVSSHLHD
jgi:hypothetical protein